MSNDPIYDHWRELSWRRKLTGAEEAELRAWLASHPEAAADWKAEAGLNAALGRLRDVPVPTNFTARVLHAIEREAAAELRWPEGSRLTWRWRRWLPRMAFATVIVTAGLFSYHQAQVVHRKKLVESVAAVSAVSSLPSPEILKDFDAIRASNPSPAPDEQLLALLQ